MSNIYSKNFPTIYNCIIFVVWVAKQQSSLERYSCGQNHVKFFCQPVYQMIHWFLVGNLWLQMLMAGHGLLLTTAPSYLGRVLVQKICNSEHICHRCSSFYQQTGAICFHLKLCPPLESLSTLARAADIVVVSCKTLRYVPVDYWNWSWSALSTEFCLRKLQTMFAVWKALIHVSTFICSMQIVRELCLFTWLPVDRSLVVRGRLRAPRQRVRCTTGQIFHASPESLWRYF